MDRKEQFQQKVEKAVIDIADYMIKHSQDGIYVGRSKNIREALNLNIYVFNEASGRLKAIGFHSGVKQFNMTQLYQRKDRQEYYYKIDESRHPNNFIETDEAKALLRKRDKKLAYNRLLEQAAFIAAFGNGDEK